MKKHERKIWLSTFLVALFCLCGLGITSIRPTQKVCAAGNCFTLAEAENPASWKRFEYLMLFNVQGVEDATSDYEMVDGSISLIRTTEGEEVRYTRTAEEGCSFTIYYLATDGGDAKLDVRQFEGDLSSYTRQTGDILVMGGKWSNGSYTFEIEPAAVTVEEDGTMSVAAWEETEEEDVEGEISRLLGLIEESYPILAYSGVELEKYEEATDSIRTATTIAQANERFEAAMTALDGLEYLTMVNGASVRLNGEQKGIRFCAELGKNRSEDFANSTYHVMIVPNSYLEYFSITEDYYAALLEGLSSITSNPFIATMEATPFQYLASEVAASGGSLKEDCWYIRGSLTNIKYDNINVDFFGIAYRVDEDGSYHYATFTQGENVRSLSGVAEAAIADEERYSEQQKAVLQSFIEMGEAQAAGKTEEEYNSEASVDGVSTVSIILPKKSKEW